MVYGLICITFRDDSDEMSAAFKEASFRVENGILFIYKGNDFESLDLKVGNLSPVFTIQEERITFLTIRKEKVEKS